MDDSLRPNIPEQFSRAGPVRQVQLKDAELWLIEKVRQPGILQIWVVVIVHVVHPYDFVALLQKALGNVESDEASRTSHEDTHKDNGVKTLNSYFQTKQGSAAVCGRFSAGRSPEENWPAGRRSSISLRFDLR